MSTQVLLGSTRSRALLGRMKRLGWGRLFAAEIPHPAAHEPWALDNGVFAAWRAGTAWNEQPFLTALFATERKVSVGKIARPLFAVLPDRVADPSSLDVSLAWLDRIGCLVPMSWFLVLQNGMDRERIRDVLEARPEIAGLFLGGDDDFKTTASSWCSLAHDLRRRFHFARVSTTRRLTEAYAIGADSCDTTQPLWSEDAFDRFERAWLSLHHQPTATEGAAAL